MSFPHLPALSEAPEAEEAVPLFARAHHKLGAAPLPLALRRLGASPTLFRDAMLNLERIIGGRPPLGRPDRLLVGIGVCAAIGADGLSTWYDTLAADAGIADTDRRAALEVAIACRTSNAYFRARALVDIPGITGFHAHLRATPLVASPLSKRVTELLCTAVSVAMACRSCATGHGKAAVEFGATLEEVDEAVRIQAVLVGLAPLDG
jgi:AhpD family alkylhydroperoxidase